jgi:cell division protein FtsW
MVLDIRSKMKGDRVIWSVLLLLSVFSMLIVYSSTGALAYRQRSGNTLYYLIRQLFFIGAGFGIIMLMVNVIPVKIYSLFAKLMVLFSIGLLIVALGMKMLHMTDASGRTLNLGPFSFQPAEIAKISLVMYAAKILGGNQKSPDELFIAFRKIILFTAVICGIIFFSNFSTASLLFLTIMSMMFIGRVPGKYLLSIIVGGLLFITVIYFTADYIPPKLAQVTRIKTIKSRIDEFLHGDPDSEKGITQADYATLAIYDGGLVGKGPGNSDVSNYMAAAYNDYIFAIIIEEYGLFVGAGVIFLYLIFFFRSIMIVRKTNRTFPAFLVVGTTLMLVFQAMINIGVSSGIFPVTGQPLPWISMGGTSLLFTSVAFGFILSVSYQNQLNQEVQQQPLQVEAPDEDEEI